MLPTAYPYNRDIILAAWHEFTRQGTCDLDILDPTVARSWQRCQQAGLDPHASMTTLPRQDAEALERRLHAHFDLIAIARPFMEDVYQFVGEHGIVIYLADRDLCILDSVGDQSLQESLHSKGFVSRSQLSEEIIGTNAAALAPSEGFPVQVVGPEHYCSTLHTFSDTAAPIHTPTGEMLGVLSIVTLESDSHPHTLGIVMAATKAIENQLRADLSLAEAHQHLAELNISLQAMSKGILFLNPEGWITHINDRAGEILGMSSHKAMGRSLHSLVTLPNEVETAMAERVPMPEKEVVFRAMDEPHPCMASVDVLWQSSNLSGFVLTLEQTAHVRQLVHRVVGARAHFTFDDILGQAPEMRRVLNYARITAQGDSNVLLLGESGTGKEMFAQAIHNEGRRANGPFIAINCAAIPREMMIGELLGYERAFATAGEDGRPGKFELADGGTIFLDNVDGMALDMQASLLRMIDTKEVIRLGGTRVISLDVRIIAASSNVDLADEVRRGHFRDDLYHRLYALTLTIPPLRERGRDILLLIAHLTLEFAHRLGKTVTVSLEAMAALQSYSWPGNIRELENVLERAMHTVEDGELTVKHLPRELRMATIGDTDVAVITFQEAERQAIIRAGRALQGNTTRMADALGIGRTTLWRRIKAFNLSTESFKGKH